MKNFKSVIGLALITLAIGFSSCTQDETMDELIDNTEISSPSDPLDREKWRYSEVKRRLTHYHQLINKQTNKDTTMKNFKSVIGLALITLAIGFSSCTQDETMDELIDNTEISSPSDPLDGKNGDIPKSSGG